MQLQIYLIHHYKQLLVFASFRSLHSVFKILTENEFLPLSTQMLIPVRCFTCNKEISSLYDEYLELLKKEYSEAEAMDHLGFKRICCRRMILCHVDIADKLMKLNSSQDLNMDL